MRYRVLEHDGAYDRSQLRDLIRRGLARETEVAIDGTDDWREAYSYPELKRYFDLAGSGTPAMPVLGLRFWSGVGLMLSGLIGVAWGSFDIVQGVRSKSWPAVQATNNSAQVVGQYERNGWRDLRVGYDYRVEGQRYTNSKPLVRY